MSQILIVYASKYGTARRYATELANRLNSPVLDYRKVTDTDSYDTVVYVGAIYAGVIMGLGQTLKKAPKLFKKRVFVLSVGLVDPADPENVRQIRSYLEELSDPVLFEKMKIYHLSGAYTHSGLSLKHRLMMWFVYNQLKKKPREELTPSMQTLVLSYGSRVDHVDFQALDKIVSDLREITV